MNDDGVIYVRVELGGSVMDVATVTAAVLTVVEAQLPALVAQALASLPIQGLN